MKLLMTLTHAIALWLGFAIALYFLPIVDGTDSSYAFGVQFDRNAKDRSGPAAPSSSLVDAALQEARYRTAFHRNRATQSTAWAEGEIGINPDQIAFNGRMSAYPGCAVHLARNLDSTATETPALLQDSARIGEVKTFSRFVMPVPAGLDIDAYTSIAIWCERSRQLVAHAPYRAP